MYNRSTMDWRKLVYSCRLLSEVMSINLEELTENILNNEKAAKKCAVMLNALLERNNSNVIVFPIRFISRETCRECLDKYFNTEITGERN